MNGGYMKKILLKVLIGLMTVLLVSCASYSYYQTRTVESLPDDVVAGSDETEIVIRNEFVWPNFTGSDDIFIFVYIDDILTAQVAHAGTERIIVPNGKHTITVKYGEVKRGPIRFTANSQKIIFRVFFGRETAIDIFGVPGSLTNSIFLEYVR